MLCTICSEDYVPKFNYISSFAEEMHRFQLDGHGLVLYTQCRNLVENREKGHKAITGDIGSDSISCRHEGTAKKFIKTYRRGGSRAIRRKHRWAKPPLAWSNTLTSLQPLDSPLPLI